jgi:hypothetical protein
MSAMLLGESAAAANSARADAVAAPGADRLRVRLTVAGILDRPLPAWAYFDLVGGWVQRPLSLRDQERMLRACPKFDARNIVAKFDHRYRQRLQLPQLTEAALRILIDCTGDEMLLNRAEIALDLLFPDRATLGPISNELPHMLLQPWNVGHEPQAFDDGFVTRRRSESGEPKRGHPYSDQPCRIDGHPHCLHLQSCVQGAQLMRRRGIHRPSDLLRFNFVSYWQHWLRLYHMDVERLGRFDDNRCNHRSRQQPRIEQWGRRLGAVNLDRMHGGRLYHILSFSDDQPSNADPRSLQQFVSSYRHGGSRPYLTRLPITLSMAMCTNDTGLS